MSGSWLGSLSAPEFTEGLDWVSTGGRAVRLADLRGRVVLLDFWTYGCINCRHVQPRLRELEERFPDTLTVIGVHAGKFAHERITANLAAACDRQNVAHAVVNDRQYRIWRAYDVNAWPTVALIAPDGELVGLVPGEFPLESMAEAIQQLVTAAEKAGTLVRGPEPTYVEPVRATRTLRFPGRVFVDDGRLIVADTGNGRVLDCSIDVVDGHAVAHVHAEHTGLAEPQGIAVLDHEVYVADRAGQVVWHLRTDGSRERVLGTGTLADRMAGAGDAPALEVRSPWGLSAFEGRLVVAMAGAHQLWLVDPKTHEARPWAGTGGEQLIDGALHEALLAQPTGVAVTVERVAFADCESSAIRVASEAEGVRTLVGKGLFDFGDRDGVGDRVLLQHAEDLTWHGEVLCVADTYNDRLKRVDPGARECEPWPGEAGEAGALREPAGVHSDGELLLVADTGNHRIVLVNADGSLSEVRFA